METTDPKYNDALHNMQHYLHHQFYPHVPPEMAPACIEAATCVFYVDEHELIDLPDGITWKMSTNAPAWALWEEFRLHNFVYDCAWCGGEFLALTHDWYCNACEPAATETNTGANA